MAKRPWTPYAVLCGTELCFCRLCNLGLSKKLRFSLQRHKSCKKLRFLRYSACAEFLGLLCRFFVAQSFGLAAFKKAGKFYFGGTGVGVVDKPGCVLCSFYVVLTGVWGWLGSQGEPRLLSILSIFYAPPPIIFCFFILFDV